MSGEATSAQTLRRAADLMREQAEAATGEVGIYPETWWGQSANKWRHGDRPPGVPKEDVEHIASWHPAVALAVADLLDHAGARAESKLAHGGNQGAVWSHERDALAVARAYLGESA